MELSNNVISEALNNYLDGTRLSMDQIAKKWNISTAMLSQIKNGKKRAGIDLGLKILRESGSDVEKRKSWLEERYLRESVEYSLVQEEFKRKNVEQTMQSQFCEMLESEPVLLDIFLDIALSEDKGISWNSIYNNYGEHGVDLGTALTESLVVIFKDNRFYINDENTTFTSDGLTSFGIVKAIIEMQRNRKKRGQFKGELQYDVTDISKDAYEKLIVLNKEYVARVRNILQDNELHRLSGGVRVFCQSLVSLAKGSLCLVLMLSFFNLSDASAGGISGGSSDLRLGGISGGTSELVNALRKPRDFFGRFGTKYTYERASLSLPHSFTEKENAVTEMVALNERLEKGEYTREILRRIMIRPTDDCKSQQGLNPNEMSRMVDKGTIKALGFSVSESYNAKGEARFSVKADFYVPCEKD